MRAAVCLLLLSCSSSESHMPTAFGVERAQPAGELARQFRIDCDGAWRCTYDVVVDDPGSSKVGPRLVATLSPELRAKLSAAFTVNARAAYESDSDCAASTRPKYVTSGSAAVFACLAPRSSLHAETAALLPLLDQALVEGSRGVPFTESDRARQSERTWPTP